MSSLESHSKDLVASRLRSLPWVTIPLLALIGLPAVFDSIRTVMVYDRAAVLQGEIWRLITGNFVHFSTSHLIYDALALGVAGVLIERCRYRGFGLMCGSAALAIGCALLIGQPEIHVYGGASGIAIAALVFLALNGLNQLGPYRWLRLAILICVAAKLMAELATGHSLFLGETADSGPPLTLVLCPLSHLVGALMAGLFYLLNASGGVKTKFDMARVMHPQNL
jgi:rhomboid family GlyGly-CTERM serine protease